MADGDKGTKLCFSAPSPFYRTKGDKSVLVEGLQTLIEQRIQEVVGICENENEALYKSFDNTFKLLKENTPDHLKGDLLKLEEYFYERLCVVETAYRIGFQDGLPTSLFR